MKTRRTDVTEGKEMYNYICGLQGHYYKYIRVDIKNLIADACEYCHRCEHERRDRILDVTFRPVEYKFSPTVNQCFVKLRTPEGVKLKITLSV